MVLKSRLPLTVSRVARPRYTSTNAFQKDKVKVLVVGGGTAGLSVAQQIFDRFRSNGKALNSGDITILDSAHYHHYQPGWSLVGSGLRNKASLRRSLASLVPPHIDLRSEDVSSFSPQTSSVTTALGGIVTYDVLVVAAGIQINWDSVHGLRHALADPNSGVSSIYSYETCDKTWHDIDSMRTGVAVFTQPAGAIKCAGTPQQILYMCWDRYRRTGRKNNIKLEFWTGTPTMFSIPKYSDILNAIRIERKIRAEFSHNLVSIDSSARAAKFQKLDGSIIETDYSLLHVTPPMGPPDFIKESPIADSIGWVDVDQFTLQHKKPEYANIFALGDCSSLPTLRSAAAITQQAPIVAENVFRFMDTGRIGNAVYDGYTGHPILTGYDKLLLAEFVYEGKVKETFRDRWNIDQDKPRRAFYYLQQHFFPWVYFSRHVKGRWFGPKGFTAPRFS